MNGTSATEDECGGEAYSSSEVSVRLTEGADGRCTSPAGVTGAGLWSATVTHGQLAGATCGIGVNTTNPIVSTAGDGEPSCYVP